MTDVRETVLARLVEIAAGVDGVDKAVRNEIEFTDKRLLAVTILEGDEETPPSFDEGRRRSFTVKVPMVMSPELMIIANEAAAALGEKLNSVRLALIKAVLSDAALASIIGGNGRVAYRGMISDLGLGRAMLGRMALRFSITYVLNPGT